MYNIHKIMMSSSGELVHQVVTELQEQRDGSGLPLTPDIDTVWVLSAPGSYNKEANDGVYSGASFDRMNIEAGIQAVKEITSLRLEKPVDSVTKEEIADHGPLFYYNGESEINPGSIYPQNQDLTRALEDPAFPLPASKVRIRPIEAPNTPGQVIEMAEYCKSQSDTQDGAVPKKVVIVSLSPHAPRVGRYIEHYRSDYPEGTEFISLPVSLEKNGFGAAVRETRKIVAYHGMGHLATKSAFAKTAKG